MYVEITGALRATLHELDNLRELEVRTHGTAREDIDAALVAAGLGSVAADHAWLDVTALREAGAGRGDIWQKRFADMVEYAGSHGWLAGDGLLVRAHLNED